MGVIFDDRQVAVGYDVVTNPIHRLRGILIALAALALSASLAFGAQPDRAHGLANAAAHAGKTVPVAAGEEATSEDENTDAEAADNCTTDPTTLNGDELAALNHGSIACWAAHQTEWPEWFSNHGKFVSCWAHQGKADAADCTVAPAAGASASSHGNGKGHNK